MFDRVLNTPLVDTAGYLTYCNLNTLLLGLHYHPFDQSAKQSKTGYRRKALSETKLVYACASSGISQAKQTLLLWLSNVTQAHHYIK